MKTFKDFILDEGWFSPKPSIFTRKETFIDSEQISAIIRNAISDYEAELGKELTQHEREQFIAHVLDEIIRQLIQAKDFFIKRGVPGRMFKKYMSKEQQAQHKAMRKQLKTWKSEDEDEPTRDWKPRY